MRTAVMAGIASLLIAPVFVGAQPASAASPVYKQHAANKIGSGTVKAAAPLAPLTAMVTSM